jgi:predicted metallo-beta-lactamase superfamily hydrolase
MAKENKDWMVSIQTVDDTKAIDPEVLEAERREIIQKNGSDAIFQQEYYCSFDA